MFHHVLLGFGFRVGFSVARILQLCGEGKDRHHVPICMYGLLIRLELVIIHGLMCLLCFYVVQIALCCTCSVVGCAYLLYGAGVCLGVCVFF